MKRAWKYLVTVVLPLTGVSALLGSCSSTPTCNNDACYDRKMSSVDPFKKGDIATWGSEKKMAEEEEAAEGRKAFNPRLRNE